MKPQEFAAEDGTVIMIEDGASHIDADVVLIHEDGDDENKLPKHAIEQPDGSVIVPLRAPVVRKFKTASTGVVREETVHELHLHRLTGADMRAVETTSHTSKAVVAIARSARMNEAKMNAIYDGMDGSDCNAVAQVIGYFLANGPRTGRSA